MPLPVEDEVQIEIADEEAPPPRKPKPNPGEKLSGNGKDKPGTGKDAPTHGLPRYVLLTKDGRSVGDQETQKWPEDLSEHDGGLIRDLGDEGTLYLINYDNSYHLKYKQQQRGDITKDVVTEKYILGMRILMLGYEHALKALGQSRADGMAHFKMSSAAWRLGEPRRRFLHLPRICLESLTLQP